MTLFWKHNRPLMVFGSCVWNLGYDDDMRLLESLQKMWTQNMDWRTRFREDSLADLLMYWKNFYGKCCIDPEDIFVSSSISFTHGQRFKVEQ